MSDPKFIGGAGLKKSGGTLGTSVATKELQARYLTYDAAEAIAIGDFVALNLAAPEPGGNWGNSVSKSNSGTAAIQHAMGIAVTTAAIGAEVIIQVEGRCDVANLPSDLGAGRMLASSAAAGVPGLRANTTGGVGIATSVCIQIGAWSGAATATSSVWLINSLNQ